MRWIQRALDRVFADAAAGPGQSRDELSAVGRKTRWALRTGENKLTDDKRALVNQITLFNRRIGRAWALKEQFRDLYRFDHQPGVARGDCSRPGSPPPNVPESQPSSH